MYVVVDDEEKDRGTCSDRPKAVIQWMLKCRLELVASYNLFVDPVCTEGAV